MRSKSKIFIPSGLFFILISFNCFAQGQESLQQKLTPASEYTPDIFYGKINSDNINIRSDATVSSKVICTVKKGEPVEVVQELYEWYKIRLPKTAPSFIKKNLTLSINEKTAKVIKDNVNIRLKPDESSPIIGKTVKNEIINILRERQGWYRIEPINESFGWVHKRFVTKVDTIEKTNLLQKTEKESKITVEAAPLDENVTIEGIIRPYGKVFNRIATHKLVTADNSVFLLKGNKAGLDSLNYRKVKVAGKLILNKKQKYTIIEIQKIESLD